MRTRQLNPTQIVLVLAPVDESIRRQLGGHCSSKILDTIQRALSCEDLNVDIQNLLAPRLAEVEEMDSEMSCGAAPRAAGRHVRFAEPDLESDEDGDEPGEADTELAEEDAEYVSNYPIAYANENFDGFASTQLSFNKGDVIEIVEWNRDSSWWVGRRDGMQGLVPCKSSRFAIRSACIDVQTADHLDLITDIPEEALVSHPAASTYEDEEPHDDEQVYEDEQAYEAGQSHEDEQPPPPYQPHGYYEVEQSQSLAVGDQPASFCSGHVRKRGKWIFHDFVCSCGWKFRDTIWMGDLLHIFPGEGPRISANGLILAKSHASNTKRTYGCKICRDGPFSFEAWLDHMKNHSWEEMLWTYGQEAFG